jgi:DNA-binding CsgD family transcriptional regulator
MNYTYNLIKNLTFTFREIDVIACIMHNRGEKKIASLLLVSPRTISAHVYNIMGKLGFSSKDQIIDFIETSDKINIIKEYYLHLLVKSSFEQKLIKIASQVNRAKLDFYYNKNDKINISEPLYQSLKKHLQLANIFLHEANTTDLNDKLVIDLNDITEQNYYNDLLQIISKIINSNLVVEILKEFHEGYKLTQDIYEGKTNHLAISNNIESKPRLFKKKFFIIFLVLCLITTLIFSFKHFLLPEKAENNSSEIIKALGDFVEALKNEQFTADNIYSPNKQSHNHNIIKKVEKLLEYKNSKKVQEYFKKTEMSSEFLN